MTCFKHWHFLFWQKCWTSVSSLPGCLNSLKEKIRGAWLIEINVIESLPSEYTQELGSLRRSGSILLLRLMPSWCSPRRFCLYLVILKDIVVLWSFDVTWCTTAKFNCTFESIIFLNVRARQLSRYNDWATRWTVRNRVPVETRFSAPVQTSPGAHPASCKTGTGSFPGVKCGRGVLLTTHPLLVPRSWKSSAIPLPTLWATPGL